MSNVEQLTQAEKAAHWDRLVEFLYEKQHFGPIVAQVDSKLIMSYIELLVSLANLRKGPEQ